MEWTTNQLLLWTTKAAFMDNQSFPLGVGGAGFR